MNLSTPRTELYAFLVILVAVSFTNAQRPQARENTRPNFRDIQKHYNEKFREKETPRTPSPDVKDVDDEETKFRRFEEFWAPRVDAKGEFTTYYKNLSAASHIRNCNNCAPSCNKTNWNLLGPDSMPGPNMGAIISVWVNPQNPSEILAGTYSAGLYRTTNGGIQWDKLTISGCKPNCSDFPISGGVNSIAVNPNNPLVIYITVGIYRGMDEIEYSYGVYKTVDGGLTWCPTDLTFDPATEYAQLKKVIMDPANPNTLFAIAGNKIYKTTNGGVTWKSNIIYAAPNNHDIQDIVISRNPGNTGLFFSEAGDRCYSLSCPLSSGWNCPLTNGKIWYDPNFNGSLKTDITFSALGIGSIPGFEVQLERALFSVTPQSVSILALSDAQGCPFTTTGDRIIARNFNIVPTFSANWTKHVNPSGASGSHGSGYASGFAVSPVDPNLVFIGSDNGGLAQELYISRDGGGSFTPNTCLHPDLRTLAFAKLDSTGERWIIGNDGGVGEVSDISSNGPSVTCKNINGSGLTVTDFLGLSNSETDPNRIYAGAQDNGVFDNTTGVWHTAASFDVYDAVTDITNSNVAYVASNHGVLQRTLDGGNTWNPIPTVGSAAWIPPLVIDRSNVLYMGKENVLRSYNASAPLPTFQPLSSWAGGKIRELHVPPLNSSIILAAKDGVIWNNPWEEKLYRTDTAHLNAIPTSWTGITYNLPIQFKLITGITSDEKGDTVWVSMGNFGAHVYQLDKGSTVWKDMSQGLPNLPVNVIKYWEGSGDDSLFIGTDTGVYYRNKNMSEWRSISCRLPNLLVSDIEINYRTQKLRASTRGGGLWETSLASIKDQGCTANSYLTVSYNSFSGPQTKDLPNNAVVTDALPDTPVTITPKNICCVEPCDAVRNYTWKVHRVRFPFSTSSVVASGQNSPVQFVLDFEDFGPLPTSSKRYNYKIEISPQCNKLSCPLMTISFNRWQ